MTANAPPRLAQPSTLPVVPLSPAAAQRPAPRGGASYPQPQAPKWQPPPSAPDEDDEDRTVQATVEQQAAAQAQYQHDFDDDNDATIVSRSAPSELMPPSDAFRPPGVAPIVPAAGMPARDRGPLPAFQSASQPPRAGSLGQTLPLDVAQPGVDRRSILRTQMGVQPTAVPPAAGGFVPPSYNISDPSLPHTLASPAVPPQQGWGAPSPYGAPPAYGPPPGAAFPYPGAAGAPGMSGMPGVNGNAGYDPGQYPPPYPNTAGQPFAPPPMDPRASTRQVIRPKRVPAWAVAVGSGLIAIVLAGIFLTIYAVFRSTHRSDAEASTGDSAATASGSTASPTTSAAATGTPPSQAGTPTGTAGLFGAARAGFLAAATPPTAGNAPDPTPTAAATAAAPAPPPPPDPTPAAAPPPPDPAPPPPAPAPPPVAVAPSPAPRTYEPPAPQPAQPAPRYQPPTPVPANGPSGGGGGAHGYLSVICLPGCDRVEIDGQNLGASPIFKRQTSVGSHRIKLVSSNPPGTKVVSKIIVADSTAVVRESMP